MSDKKKFRDKNKQVNFSNFDWKSYLSNNIDLININTKEEAWNHWNNYGKYEYRINLNDSKKNFDWKTYVNNYEDLKDIKTENEAFIHWIKFGIKENRSYKVKITENSDSELKNFDSELKSFDWKTYVNNYEDLKEINTEKEAANHWKNYGVKENRTCINLNIKIEIDHLMNFDWKIYVNNYEDLKDITTEKEAMEHFLLFGVKENRLTYDIKKRELDDYNNIIQIEDSFENMDYSENKILFKKAYINCGKHYFGWKNTINYYKNNFDENLNINLKNLYYFDEWLEKLLLWGNKIQNEKCLKNINENKLKLITFLHCPPFDSYNEYKDDLILDDDLSLNNNIVKSMFEINLQHSITYLYVLSKYHKTYVYNNYPELKNKVVSICHPINIDNDVTNEFDFDNFIENRNIYHVGWWLRNYKTFIDVKLPKKYNKLILLKQDIKKNFLTKFKDMITDIEIVDEVDDEEYTKIFSNSCIFSDIIDGVSNNVVLECIKFNTPIFLRRLPSTEEYIGIDYPLFFDNINHLNIIMDDVNLDNLIKETHLYLKNMNKKHLLLETFKNKLDYDISKLKQNTSEYRLTTLYNIENESDNIEKYILDFKNKIIKNNIKLIIINKFENNKEILEKYDDLNIKIINVEDTISKEDVYNIFIENVDTDYLSLDSINVLHNVSNKLVNYFDSNNSYDVVLYKSNTNSIKSKRSNNNFEIENNVFELNSSDSKNENDDFELNSNDSKNENDDFELNSSDSKNENDDFELNSSDSKNENDYIKNYNDKLLTFEEINDIKFISNVNKVWRKSIHTYFGNYEDNFLNFCSNNNLNIVELNI